MRYIGMFLFFLRLSHLFAQQPSPDSVNHSFNQLPAKNSIEKPSFRLTTKNIILPASLITYGVIAQCNEDLRNLDKDIKKVVRRDTDFHTPVDNYLQYVPAMSVYALNAAGIKGKNNIYDETLIYLMSNAMMGATVQTIKKITKVPRPEGFGTNAFPSGHTATAFAGAELLRLEYEDRSSWYGIAGYATAATTGILRMYNNKHWFRDVVAGSGFGILATDVAYYLEPMLVNKLIHKRTYSYSDPVYY